MIKRIKKLKKIRLHREGTDTLVYGFIFIAAIALLLWRFCDNKAPFWCFAVIFAVVSLPYISVCIAADAMLARSRSDTMK